MRTRISLKKPFIRPLYSTNKHVVRVWRSSAQQITTTCCSSMACLTADIWTDNAMKSMIGVTVHDILEGKTFYGTIGVIELTESHTAQHISTMLKTLLLEFNINVNSVSAVVTDNARNMIKSISDGFDEHRHIPCFAHTLNLLCEQSLQITEVAEIVTSCRRIVTWFKRHVKANDKLRQLQSADGIPEGKMLKLILDVPTRWNSCFYMLERFAKLTPYISQILMTFSESPPMITSQTKDEILEIINLLRPLEAMTKQISGEKYATLSQCIPLVPRFKKIHFQDSLSCSTIIKKIRQEMNEISLSDESNGSLSDTSSLADQDFDLWSIHKSLAHKRRTKDDDLSQPQDELTFFLNAPVLDLKRDVITAWEEMKAVYPKLYIIAQRYCHLIGTSVPAERLFSKAGETATLSRNRLTTKCLSNMENNRN